MKKIEGVEFEEVVAEARQLQPDIINLVEKNDIEIFESDSTEGFGLVRLLDKVSTIRGRVALYARQAHKLIIILVALAGFFSFYIGTVGTGPGVLDGSAKKIVEGSLLAASGSISNAAMLKMLPPAAVQTVPAAASAPVLAGYIGYVLAPDYTHPGAGTSYSINLRQSDLGSGTWPTT